jgi:hypothetical protein
MRPFPLLALVPLALAAPALWAQSPPASAKTDLVAAALGGVRVIDTQIADLNGDGRPDALVVIEPAAVAGQAPGSRDLVILVRNAAGELKKVAHNNRLIPCATCGGAAGDPYAGIQIDAQGQFTVLLHGGGREQWSDSYSFLYESQYHEWLFTKAVRRVEDRETGQTDQVAVGATDFGGPFGTFDPSTLPTPKLPPVKVAQLPKVQVPVYTLPVNPYLTKPAAPAAALACPGQDFPTFFVAFANSEAVQKAFVTDPFFSQTVTDETKNSDGEPEATTQQLRPGQIVTPLIPTIAEQVEEGLTVSQTYPRADEAKVIIRKEDTDYQMSMTFRKVNGCWRASRLQDDTL